MRAYGGTAGQHAAWRDVLWVLVAQRGIRAHAVTAHVGSGPWWLLGHPNGG